MFKATRKEPIQYGSENDSIVIGSMNTHTSDYKKIIARLESYGVEYTLNKWERPSTITVKGANKKLFWAKLDEGRESLVSRINVTTSTGIQYLYEWWFDKIAISETTLFGEDKL